MTTSITNLYACTILEHQKRDREIEAFAMAFLFDSAEVSKIKRARNTRPRGSNIQRHWGGGVGASSHESSSGRSGAPWCACSHRSGGVGAPSQRCSGGSGGVP